MHGSRRCTSKVAARKGSPQRSGDVAAAAQRHIGRQSWPAAMWCVRRQISAAQFPSAAERLTAGTRRLAGGMDRRGGGGPVRGGGARQRIFGSLTVSFSSHRITRDLKIFVARTRDLDWNRFIQPDVFDHHLYKLLTMADGTDHRQC